MSKSQLLSVAIEAASTHLKRGISGPAELPGDYDKNSIMEVALFDPQKILQQVLGDGGNSEVQENKRGGISKDTFKGAALGGLAGLLLGSKQGRQLGGSALQLGGLAVLGGLAYKAWQNWEQQKANTSSGAGQAGQPNHGAEGTVFLPNQETKRNELSTTLLSAMISAAKSDGHIDATEQERIFVKIDEGDLSASEKGFLMDQIRKPLDIDAIAAKASTPELAAEIYAASLLAIDPDDPKETAYLNTLASRLKLDSGLRENLETVIKGELMRNASQSMPHS